MWSGAWLGGWLGDWYGATAYDEIRVHWLEVEPGADQVQVFWLEVEPGQAQEQAPAWGPGQKRREGQRRRDESPEEVEAWARWKWDAIELARGPEPGPTTAAAPAAHASTRPPAPAPSSAPASGAGRLLDSVLPPALAAAPDSGAAMLRAQQEAALLLAGLALLEQVPQALPRDDMADVALALLALES